MPRIWGGEAWQQAQLALFLGTAKEALPCRGARDSPTEIGTIVSFPAPFSTSAAPRRLVFPAGTKRACGGRLTNRGLCLAMCAEFSSGQKPRGWHLSLVPSGSKGECCLGFRQWQEETAAPERWEGEVAFLEKRRLSSSACLGARTPGGWRVNHLLAGSISSCLEASPVDGGLGRTPSSEFTGTPAHGLGGTCSTWLPCARSLHSLGTRRNSLPSPQCSGCKGGSKSQHLWLALSRALQPGSLKGNHSLSGRDGGVPVSGRQLFLPRIENETL